MMIAMKRYWESGAVLMLCVLMAGCGKDQWVDAAKESDSFVRFARNEIMWLQKIQPGMRKMVTSGEDVSTETLDSVEWSNELEMIRSWSVSEYRKKHTYDETVDSAGSLMIVRYNAQDTLAELQELMVTYRKGKIDLMQWDIKQRSWYMDRDLRVSFQPRKGYGVRVSENAVWASPRAYEIFAEINNKEFLINGE
jgi:hypothetical protein